MCEYFPLRKSIITQKRRGKEPVQKTQKRWIALPLSLIVGLLSGFFGAGGGMIGVPMLRWLGLPTKQCHATCIALTMPLAAVSAGLYLHSGAFKIGDALPYLPGGFLGAAAGAMILPKVKGIWVRRIFGGIIIFAAIRLLIR